MAKNATYEQDMEKLQEIVDKLSGGNIPLEEMVKLYEEGRALAEKCRKTLDAYEARLTVLNKAGEE